jgi:hypothetical protein
MLPALEPYANANNIKEKNETEIANLAIFTNTRQIQV